MIRHIIILAVMASAPATAWAQEHAPMPGIAGTAASGGASAAGTFESSAAISEADLGSVTGREDIARSMAVATQRNTVANNSVTGNSVTGGVSIDGNAFQNLQGLAVISANSGNNVAINAAMNVTITMTPTMTPRP